MKPGASACWADAPLGKSACPVTLQRHIRVLPTPGRAAGLAIRCGQVPAKPFEGFVARPPNSEMRLDNAWSLAHACDLSYLTQPEVAAAASDWGLKGLRCYGYGDTEGPDTQCFAAAGPDFIVVAFRGTTSVTDWVRDLKVWKQPGGPLDSEVHYGFLEGMQGVWKGQTILDSVLQGVRELEAEHGEGGEDLAIYVTGHSLGGALATLAAAYMLEDPQLRDDVAGHYTFGSPRVGSAQFRKRFEALAPAGRAMAHRFQNREDLVSRVPAWWRDYDHVGNWWYFAGDDQHLTRAPDLWTRVKDLIEVDWDLTPDFVYDHQLRSGGGPGGYIEGIEKNIIRGG